MCSGVSVVHGKSHVHHGVIWISVVCRRKSDLQHIKFFRKPFGILFCSFYVFDLVVLKPILKTFAFLQKFTCGIDGADDDPTMARAQKQCIAAASGLK